MLEPFPIEDLLLPTIFLLFSGFLISLFITKKVVVSLCIALFKSAFFFIYFSVFFNGQYTFSDDWGYIELAKKVQRSHSFIELITQHLFELEDIFGKGHFVYQLYNILAFEFFGPYYFAPVALNILLTYFSGYILTLLTQNFGFTLVRTKALFVFFILHWDVVFWSSIPNLKDMIITFLTISMLYIISLFITKKIKIKHYILLILIIIIFSYIRFYLPYLILFAFLIYIFFRKISLKMSLKNISLIGGFGAVMLSIIVFLNMNIRYLGYVKLFLGDFTNPVIGIFRYFLSPIPFHMESAYEFLLIPSLAHWFLLPVFIFGIFISFKINKNIAGFLLAYLLCLLLFYGSYSELQGPRHRVQLTPLIAFYQFLGLFYILRIIIKGKEPDKISQADVQ